MRIYLQTPAAPGETLRFYHLILQRDLLGGWSLTRVWGPQGTSGRSRNEHFPTVESAQEALFKARDRQIERGYKVMFVQGATHAGE